MLSVSTPRPPAAGLSDRPLPDFDPNRRPYPARSLDLAGMRITVRATPGSSAAAQAACYVHGLGGSSTNWTDLAALLADEFDAVAMDLPGYGDSGPAAGRDYSLGALADAVTAVIEARRTGSVHLIGNSLGGAVCVVVAARRPDLVRTLTLISPAMPDLLPRRGPRWLMAVAAMPGLSRRAGHYLTGADPTDRVNQVMRFCFADPSVVPTTRLAEAVEEARKHQSLPWSAEAFIRSVRGLIIAYLLPGKRSLWAQAARITAPTLVLWGRQDKLVPVSLADRTARTIPDARLLVLPNVGHTAHLEAPVVTARAILGLLDDVAAV